MSAFVFEIKKNLELLDFVRAKFLVGESAKLGLSFLNVGDSCFASDRSLGAFVFLRSLLGKLAQGARGPTVVKWTQSRFSLPRSLAPVDGPSPGRRGARLWRGGAVAPLFLAARRLRLESGSEPAPGRPRVAGRRAGRERDVGCRRRRSWTLPSEAGRPVEGA